MEIKTFLGILAVVVELVSYGIYFLGIWKGKTKPHAFTWLAWGFLNTIVFLATLAAGGEAGSWILAVNAILCLVISLIGLKQKNTNYDKYDWIALSGALFGAILWIITKNPLYAVVLVVISDSIGAIPTFRKAYRLPFEENLPSFTIGVSYYLIAIFALEKLSVTTLLFPVVIALTDAALVILISVRRKNLRRN